MKTRAEAAANYGVRTEKEINGERYFFYNMDTTIVDTIADIRKLNWWVTWEMRKRFDEWFAWENSQRGSLFFMELYPDAVDWDTPFRIPVRENGMVYEWFHNLSHLRSVHEGIKAWYGRGLYGKIHGNYPVVSWEALRCVGACRPDGSVARFFPQDQINYTPLHQSIGEVCRLLKLAGPNFNPEEDLDNV